MALESASACVLGLVIQLYLVLPRVPGLLEQLKAVQASPSVDAGVEAFLVVTFLASTLVLMNRLAFANGQTKIAQ